MNPAGRIGLLYLRYATDHFTRGGMRTRVVIVHWQNGSCGNGETFQRHQIRQRSLTRLQDSITASDQATQYHRITTLEA
ncbi:hypothetical protein GCM10010096_22360 [Alcaligenes pakistanensis]|uniref:Uncharacterized protein n=1 Tax=Alcaligenes pakistanensis TaxID=1482717 RepID=A0A8H9M5V4_9BURK|nr:hypothetical protein GCM10010096_22360 [Alcaligenes pakistanensis]